jgi:class 3 adenylate cyclase
MTSEASSSQPSLAMASVLFLDIVGFSLNPIEKQQALLNKLQEIVRRTKQFQQANSADQLISLPTGDGMALVFFQDPVVPVRCAIEIQSALRVNSELRLRAGVHIGPIFRHSDIQDNINVVGGGINMAQRVMDCGDAGHILVSRSVAEVLEQLTEWPPYLHDLGVCEVKHGVRIHLYNVYNAAAGNPELPAKLKAVQKLDQRARGRRWRWLALALSGCLALLAIVLYSAYRRPESPVPNLPTAQQRAARTLRYYILVQKYRDGKPYQQQFRLSGERVFEADYRIRLMLTNTEAGHLYVLNEGPNSTSENPDLNTLFPSAAAEGGSSRLETGQQIEIPRGGYFVFDKESGKEKLWLIGSADEVRELEALRKWTNPKDRGAIRDIAQAREIRALLDKYALHQASAAVDPVHLTTLLTGSADLLVRRIELDHD